MAIKLRFGWNQYPVQSALRKNGFCVIDVYLEIVSEFMSVLLLYCYDTQTYCT